MKLMKTTALAAAAIGLVAVAGTQMGTSTAKAQSAESAPAAASSIPEHKGTFSSGKLDTVTYTPACPAFVFDFDAAAIQESNSRAFVESEKRRFENIRDKWDAYEDCLMENGSRDIDRLRVYLGDYLSSMANDEAKAFNAMNGAATANIERIGKLPAPKASKKKGETASEAAAPTFAAWTAPTGRFVGTLTASGDTFTYQTSCPSALGSLTEEAFNTETTRNGFNAKLDELRATPDRINQVRACRQENVGQDYELIKTAVNQGVNAVFLPAKNDFERKFAAVRFQLNEHQKPGGLLAPPELPKPPAKKAPAPAPKKKK
ncbi:hypothetical protein PbB2_01010 [Candidatus Phycosocius bacilliformis]|uniref:Uncharacterized protein n=1 Tax=Candidatus Phycosocius bacilliformis TaxID=1445552 RepID=A0A2P2E8G1_9PROT|nr:hypothetical protein [Candidatus Phycosocius bacilliformis]GBF57345.1 hypothetical protein PbB2_01010 [Candidatus Phycosocius bacilliformis]